MICELYGLPASGKTHYIRELAVRGYVVPRVKNVWVMVRYAFYFWVSHPRCVWRLWKIVWRHSRDMRMVYTKLTNGLGHRLARYYIPVSGKRIIDEGVVHNIFALSDDVLSEEEIKGVLEVLPSVDEYMRVCASREVRLERAEARGRMFSRTRSSYEDTELLSVTEQNEELVHKLLPEYVTVVVNERNTS